MNFLAYVINEEINYYTYEMRKHFCQLHNLLINRALLNQIKCKPYHSIWSTCLWRVEHSAAKPRVFQEVGPVRHLAANFESASATTQARNHSRRLVLRKAQKLLRVFKFRILGPYWDCKPWLIHHFLVILICLRIAGLFISPCITSAFLVLQVLSHSKPKMDSPDFYKYPLCLADGRHHKEKNVYLWALSKLHLPPAPPGPFCRTSKTMFLGVLLNWVPIIKMMNIPLQFRVGPKVKKILWPKKSVFGLVTKARRPNKKKVFKWALPW